MYTCVLQFADLSLPVALCEPVTDMQRRGDFLEYVELLHEVSCKWLDLPEMSFSAQQSSCPAAQPDGPCPRAAMHCNAQVTAKGQLATLLRTNC